MRRPSARIFGTVVLKTFAPGTKPRSYSAGTTLAGTVQDTGSERMVRIGGLHPETTAVALFPAPPVDTSAGARSVSAGNALGPEAEADDLIVAGGLTYAVLARARNEGGRSSLWSLALVQRA